eukprot:3683647-Rhodomonas_salina.1
MGGVGWLELVGFDSSTRYGPTRHNMETEHRMRVQKNPHSNLDLRSQPCCPAKRNTRTRILAETLPLRTTLVRLCVRRTAKQNITREFGAVDVPKKTACDQTPERSVSRGSPQAARDDRGEVRVSEHAA